MIQHMSFYLSSQLLLKVRGHQN